MPVLLVTYDLNRETDSSDRSKVLTYIQKYPWARLSESSYAIQTAKTPDDIVAELNTYIDANDYLLVMYLRKPYAGRNRRDVIDWLDARLQ